MHVLSLCVLASIVVATSSLSCYICNSLMQSDCEDNYQQFLRPCPVKSFGGQKAVKPIACRVSRQYISDEYSIVRECAYTGEDVVGKSNKGSMGVSRVFSQCSDKPGCNSAVSLTSFLIVSVSLFSSLFLFF